MKIRDWLSVLFLWRSLLFYLNRIDDRPDHLVLDNLKQRDDLVIANSSSTGTLHHLTPRPWVFEWSWKELKRTKTIQETSEFKRNPTNLRNLRTIATRMFFQSILNSLNLELIRISSAQVRKIKPKNKLSDWELFAFSGTKSRTQGENKLLDSDANSEVDCI